MQIFTLYICVLFEVKSDLTWNDANLYLLQMGFRRIKSVNSLLLQIVNSEGLNVDKVLAKQRLSSYVAVLMIETNGRRVSPSTPWFANSCKF